MKYKTSHLHIEIQKATEAGPADTCFLSWQVAELREDLARDEEIFAAKQQELRATQADLAAVRADNAKLQGQLRDTLDELAALQEAFNHVNERQEAHNKQTEHGHASHDYSKSSCIHDANSHDLRPRNENRTNSNNQTKHGDLGTNALTRGASQVVHAEGDAKEDTLTVTMLQSANRAMASMVDDDDLVQVYIYIYIY